MPQRFSIEEHEKRMRELLKPKPPGGNDLLTKFQEIGKKRKARVIPSVIRKEI